MKKGTRLNWAIEVFHHLFAFALVVPDRERLGVHTVRDRRKEVKGLTLAFPITGEGMTGVQCALGDRIKDLVGADDCTGGKGSDVQTPAGSGSDAVAEVQYGGAVKNAAPAVAHTPVDFRSGGGPFLFPPLLMAGIHLFHIVLFSFLGRCGIWRSGSCEKRNGDQKNDATIQAFSHFLTPRGGL